MANNPGQTTNNRIGLLTSFKWTWGFQCSGEETDDRLAGMTQAGSARTYNLRARNVKFLRHQGSGRARMDIDSVR